MSAFRLSKATCPRCRLPLEEHCKQKVFGYTCRQCGGEAFAAAGVREEIGLRAYRALWGNVRDHGKTGVSPCPLCLRPMSLVRVGTGVEFDVCRRCQLFWLDEGERAGLPHGPPPEVPSQRKRMAPALEEAVARWEVEQMKNHAREPEFISAAPDSRWKLIAAALGLPVEVESDQLFQRPLLTWGLVASLCVVYAITWSDPEGAIASFALLPAHPWRLGGLTLVTAGFLHASPVHLLGNAYFLLIFGDDVEEELGRARFLALYLAALLAGNVLHVLGDPSGDVPLVGASGAISGVVTYYALELPHRRLILQFGTYIHFVTWPAWFWYAFWVMSQCAMAMFQLVGASRVSALAHLGGAATGMLAWLAWSRRRRLRSRSV